MRSEVPAVLTNSGHSTTKVKVTAAPAAPPWLRTNAGDDRALTLATGVYNERLVRRGELSIALDFIGRWDDLLAEMNAGKRGRPYQYPEPFIAWMACIHTFLLMPYRRIQQIDLP